MARNKVDLNNCMKYCSSMMAVEKNVVKINKQFILKMLTRQFCLDYRIVPRNENT